MAISYDGCTCGGTPGSGGDGCCAPSITSTPLCRPDCSTILLVMRSGCVACGAAPTVPEVVGWVDPATGVFTAGPAPADAGQCDGCNGCAETMCVTRCDDTDGDGLADTTYSELWCIKADGSTELILTYQGEPSQPYVPVAPVDCEHGTIQCHTQILCDDTGSFLRRYVFASNGQATYQDVNLDGQTPHLVQGLVRDCAFDPCQAGQAPLATIGLCLSDGTPIGVVVTRNCDGTIRQQGWLDLTTGVYSAGQPPVGVTACGTTRSVSTTGTWCDTDPTTGEVYGLVLVEYAYGPDGTIIVVRLVDATTGQTYVPQGTVTVCPTGEEQPDSDLVVLCETRPDGTVIRFVRDYHRNENNLIVGHTDYGLDGANYQPDPASSIGNCLPDCSFQYVLRQELCDDTDDDGQPDTQYVALMAVDCQGQVTTLATRTCDLAADYVPVAPVDCDVPDSTPPVPEPCNATFSTLCDIAADGTSTPFQRKLVYTCSGYVLETADLAMDGITPYRVQGTVGVCPPDAPTPVTHLLREERCDDTDGDGLPDTCYTVLVEVDSTGTLTQLGTYLCDLTGPYQPVAPVDCDLGDDRGPERPVGVQARRVQLTAGQAWTAAAYGLLRTVEATARGGTGQITTADGTTSLADGETATWAISRDMDVRLSGPLTITATTGLVTINWTEGVDL